MQQPTPKLSTQDDMEETDMSNIFMGLSLSNSLVNNKLENICYINASLNLLNSSRDFSNFFCEKKYLNSEKTFQDYPVSTEVTNIFNSNDANVKSSAVLRQLCNFAEGIQQDITEFHSTLLNILCAEFERNDCDTGRELINKFIGTEEINHSFVNLCSKCNYVPEDRVLEFKILSVDVVSSVPGCKLSEIVRQHYENPDIRELKCQCPGSPNKPVTVSTSLLHPPENLLIELRRYQAAAGDQIKCSTIVKLDDVLKLPNGDSYHLTAVADHRGTTINTGHYVAYVKLESGWLLINDDCVSYDNKQCINSPDNLFIYYSKTKNRLIHTDKSGDVSAASLTEKVTCLNCGKKYKHIFRHISTNKNCGIKYDFDSEKKKFNDFMKEMRKQYRADKKERDPEEYSRKKKIDNAKCRDKRKEEDPEEFYSNERMNRSKSRDKRKEEDPEEYSRKKKIYNAKCREMPKTREGIIAAFRRSVRYGAIFVCVSCHRKMFEDSVVKYAGSVRAKIESYDGLFERTIVSFDQVPNIFDNTYYLCLTCKKYLCQGKMPGICHSNNLDIDHAGQTLDIKDDDGNKIGEYTLTQEDIDNTTLTDLEQSLIARSLIFMKIHKLPKSRMPGMKDKLVYVPIPESNTLNSIKTILRTPSEAGILPVKIKRKMEYKGHHLEEYVSIPKIIASLRLLVKLRHPEYRFLTNSMIDQYEAECLNEASDDKD